LRPPHFALISFACHHLKKAILLPRSRSTLILEPFTLSSLKGKNVVLYFYPKADTPGCTKESCEFRDTSKKFTKANTVIVGISPDPTKAQAKFKEKFDLPFVLLADVDHKACEDYDVWKEKSMYGKKYTWASSALLS
jgi:peroxiredoxin Q/BCP